MNKNGLEIERKFLIEYPPLNTVLKNPLCRELKMEQTYLSGGGRIRKIEENGKVTFIKTVKKHINHIKREEKEWEISEEEYLRELECKAEGTNTIFKTRYVYPVEKLNFEIDLFPFWKDRAFLEIELLNEEQEFIIPDFLRVIKEVTFDKRYNNSSLAKKIVNEDINRQKL